MWFSTLQLSFISVSTILWHCLLSSTRNLNVAGDNNLGNKTEEANEIISGLNCKVWVQFENYEDFCNAMKVLCGRSMQKVRIYIALFHKWHFCSVYLLVLVWYFYLYVSVLDSGFIFPNLKKETLLIPLAVILENMELLQDSVSTQETLGRTHGWWKNSLLNFLSFVLFNKTQTRNWFNTEYNSAYQTRENIINWRTIQCKDPNPFYNPTMKPVLCKNTI